jgi:hypothetical protein
LQRNLSSIHRRIELADVVVLAGRDGDDFVVDRVAVWFAGGDQGDLSWRASLHRTEVSQIERGLRLCRVDTVAKLAGALEIDAGKLYEGIVWEPGDVRYGRFRPDAGDTL